MTLVKNYQQYLESKHTGSDYKYGCIYFYLDIPHWNTLISHINEADLYEKENPSRGLETEPHITILYGIENTVRDSQVQDIMNQIDGDKIQVLLQGIGSFQNKDNDVVKINVKSEYLHYLNSLFRGLPHQSDFPDYKPHVTMAYVNPGSGSKYIDDSFQLEISGIKQIVYSKANGEKIISNV